MDGAAVESELVARGGGVEFSVAADADDPDIRALLRRTPMPGAVQVTLEREPHFARAVALEGLVHRTIVARESRDGLLVAMGSVAIRDAWVNGAVRPVGYLSQLRLDLAYRGHAAVLLRGYRFLDALRNRLPAELYFTSIVSDNGRARRFLEAGVRGMPVYRFVGELVTVVMRSRRPPKLARDVTSATDADVPAIASFLRREQSRWQLAPNWSEHDLRLLRPDDFVLARERGEIVGVAAVWDQRAFKQTIVRGYSATLRGCRPMMNLLARCGVGVRLPAVGKALAMAYLSHVAVARDRLDVLRRLVDAARRLAAERGIELLACGFAASDARHASLPPGRKYASRLYQLVWTDGDFQELDGRIPHPEVALL